MMTITEHNRTEWARLAADAEKHRRHDKAAFFARLAADPGPLPIAIYDRAMTYYRQWLIVGYPKD